MIPMMGSYGSGGTGLSPMLESGTGETPVPPKLPTLPIYEPPMVNHSTKSLTCRESRPSVAR
jgi:hypothetical protein